MARRNILTQRLRTKPPFVITLAIISILGFMVIALNQFTGIDIQKNTVHLLFIIMGVGLVFEGEINKLIKGKIAKEFVLAKTITITVGVLSFMVGVVGLLNITIQGFEFFKGLLSIIAIVAIISEIFFIK